MLLRWLINLEYVLCTLKSDKEGPKKSPQGITIPVLTFGAIGIGCILLFTFVKNQMKDIYMPRRILNRGRPPPISRSNWLSVVYNTDEEFLINTVGLDGVMLLRFLKTGYRLYAVLSILGLFVLAPVNYYSNPPNISKNMTYLEMESLILPTLSIGNIPSENFTLLRILLGLCYLISFITFGFLFRLYRKFLALKLQYDEYALMRTKLSKIEMRTVMIFGVPRDLRSEVNLSVYLENLGIGQVDSVVLCRNWSLLQTAVQKRALYLEKLENLYTLSEKTLPEARSPPLLDGFFPAHLSAAEQTVEEVKNRFRNVMASKRPTIKTGFMGLFGPKVDAVDYYCKCFLEWDAKVTRLRKASENSSPTHIAFVTFQSPMSATLASQVVVSQNPFSLLIRMAPEPRDIFWNNLSAKSANNYSKFFRSIVSMSAMVLLVTSSTVVVSSLAALIDLEQLAKDFPILQFINDIPPAWKQFIQGIIPPSLLALWNSLLPSLLLILCQFQGLEAESWIQFSLLSKYFYYMIWNVVFVIPLANTLVWKILINPQSIIERLGEMLPKASTTLLNYIILQGLSIFPAQLLLASPLFFTWLTRLFSNSTPRQISNAYYPSMLTFSVVNYGYIYPVPILVFVIGLCYSLISPIILPFCTLFFAIGYIVMKYILMYVHFPDYESRGSATIYVMNRCLAGMVLFHFTTMGVLALKAADHDHSNVDSAHEWSRYAQMVIGILPLPALTFLVFTLMNQGYQKQIKNIPLEILGKVQKFFSHVVEEKDEAPMGHHPSEEDSRLLNRLSVFKSPPSHLGQEESSRHDQPFGYSSGVEARSEEGGTSSVHLRHKESNTFSLLDPTLEDISPFHNPEERDPLISTQAQHGSYDFIDDQELDEGELMKQHIEPPMTRTPGILNIPIGASMLRYGEIELMKQGIDDDGQLHTYYHPALIGKLPTAWFKEPQFQELRAMQDQEQRLMIGRLTSQQRLAIDDDLMDTADETRSVGVWRSFLGFFDGFTSWFQEQGRF